MGCPPGYFSIAAHNTVISRHHRVDISAAQGRSGPLTSAVENIPGVTGCLRCADLHRSDRDAAWPAVASQLRDTVGSADRATVLATAALALNQVDRVIRAVRGGEDVGISAEPPPTLDTTLEFERQRRRDRGAPVVASSPLLVLKTLVAKSLRSPQIRHG